MNVCLSFDVLSFVKFFFYSYWIYDSSLVTWRKKMRRKLYVLKGRRNVVRTLHTVK